MYMLPVSNLPASILVCVHLTEPGMESTINESTPGGGSDINVNHQLFKQKFLDFVKTACVHIHIHTLKPGVHAPT